MPLTESPLSSVTLRQTPQRFETLLGVSVAQCDALFDKVSLAERHRQQARHRLWEPARVERLMAQHRAVLREHLCLTFLYLRQYPIQEVLAASFGITQSQVSKIVKRLAPLLEHVVPTPTTAVAALTACVEAMPAAIRAESAAPVILDASEQRIERSRETAQQRADYSGEKSVTVASFNSSSHRMA